MSACCHNGPASVASVLPEDYDCDNPTYEDGTPTRSIPRRAALSRLASADAKPNAAQRRTMADLAYLNELSKRLAEWK